MNAAARSRRTSWSTSLSPMGSRRQGSPLRRPVTWPSGASWPSGTPCSAAAAMILSAKWYAELAPSRASTLARCPQASVTEPSSVSLAGQRQPGVAQLRQIVPEACDDRPGEVVLPVEPGRGVGAVLELPVFEERGADVWPEVLKDAQRPGQQRLHRVRVDPRGLVVTAVLGVPGELPWCRRSPGPVVGEAAFGRAGARGRPTAPEPRAGSRPASPAGPQRGHVRAEDVQAHRGRRRRPGGRPGRRATRRARAARRASRPTMTGLPARRASLSSGMPGARGPGRPGRRPWPSRAARAGRA